MWRKCDPGSKSAPRCLPAQNIPPASAPVAGPPQPARSALTDPAPADSPGPEIRNSAVQAPTLPATETRVAPLLQAPDWLQSGSWFPAPTTIPRFPWELPLQPPTP